jgi:hypothetical protein
MDPVKKNLNIKKYLCIIKVFYNIKNLKYVDVNLLCN